MIIETIRVSQQARDQLITLKRKTKIEHWNVLCRWAFCISIAEPSKPPFINIPSDSSIEMSWKVFGGNQAGIYEALLKLRCKKDGISLTDTKKVSDYFRVHLHRGISYLYANKSIKNIRDLIAVVTKV